MLYQNLSKSIYRKTFRSIEVPENLDDVLDIDKEGEVSAAEAGLDQAKVDEIWQATQELFRTGIHPLLTLCLRRHGKIILNRSLGYVKGVGAAELDQKPLVASLDTPICLFSASKAVSAMMIHLLAEQGKVNLLDPISYYIPAFAARGKGNISIQQLLSHRGGVPMLKGEDVDVDLLFDREDALKRICACEPTDLDGRVMAYHAITSGFIMDELIRLTTGMDIQQYLDKYIRKPLGMKYFHYGVDKKLYDKTALNYVSGLPNGPLIGGVLKKVFGVEVDDSVELSNDKRFYQAVVASANLFATAEEVSRFFQVLLDHGQWQGKQIFQPLTVHRAIREAGKAQLDRALFLPMRYSAGMMLGGKPIGIFGKDSHYAYGHIGFSNIFCWADPARDISVSIMNTGKPVLGPHIKALPGLIATIADNCPPVVDMNSDEPAYRRAKGRAAS
jgi:CubicO group peptidase (beta-lactamase class C family)